MKTDIKINKAISRKYAIEAGFYDGRFKTKVEIPKKYKKPKYKKNIFA